MNKNNVLSVLVLVVVALLIGMAVGYAVHSEPDVEASTKPSTVVVYRNAPVPDDLPSLQLGVVAITVQGDCLVQKPIRHHVSIKMHTIRTFVHTDTEQEDSDNGNDSTATATPTAIITTVPTATSTPTPTATAKAHVDNGPGNGPDAAPKGLVGKVQGNNDDDESTLPCGDPGNPCNRGGAHKDVVVPLFVLDAIINACIAYKNKHYSKNTSIDNLGNPLLDYMYKPKWALIKRDSEYQIVSYTDGCDPLYGYGSWDLVCCGLSTFEEADSRIPR